MPQHFLNFLAVGVIGEGRRSHPAGDIARKLGIAQQTFYRWKSILDDLEHFQ